MMPICAQYRIANPIVSVELLLKFIFFILDETNVIN
jgi:hypothetical protein